MQQPQLKTLRAINSDDFNRCYYCGCVATKQDIVPSNQGTPLAVPACSECFRHLKQSTQTDLDERIKVAKAGIQKQYAEPLRIYQLWDEDELGEMDQSFSHSIKAGMKLGLETYQRIRFKPFAYEIDGMKVSASDVLDKGKFKVFERQFDHFREALHFASTSYRIPKVLLSDLYHQHQQNFDKAIESYQREMEEKQFKRELQKKSIQFAKQYRQNSHFVERTVLAFMERDEDMSIDMALRMIKEKYVVQVE